MTDRITEIESTIKKLNTEKEELEYVEGVKSRGLKVGDKVKILREAEDREKGWINSWVDDMYNRVGEVVTIQGADNGIGFSIEEDVYKYPYFILEKVVEPPKIEFRHGDYGYYRGIKTDPCVVVDTGAGLRFANKNIVCCFIPSEDDIKLFDVTGNLFDDLKLDAAIEEADYCED